MKTAAISTSLSSFSVYNVLFRVTTDLVFDPDLLFGVAMKHDVLSVVLKS